MRTTVDRETIARGRRVGQVANFIGVFLVFLGLIASFTPYKAITVVSVALGVVMYTIGNRGLSQADREVRFVEQLEDELGGLDDRHRLYSHVLPGDHVLVTPRAIYVLVVKGMEGRVRCYRDKWVRDISLRRLLRFFTDEPLGNPTKDAQGQVKKMEKYLSELDPQPDVAVQPLVVFANPGVRLETTGATLPVLPLRRLRSFVRKAAPKEEIPPETLGALTRAFEEARSA